MQPLVSSTIEFESSQGFVLNAAPFHQTPDQTSRALKFIEFEGVWGDGHPATFLHVCMTLSFSVKLWFLGSHSQQGFDKKKETEFKMMKNGVTINDWQ